MISSGHDLNPLLCETSCLDYTEPGFKFLRCKKGHETVFITDSYFLDISLVSSPGCHVSRLSSFNFENRPGYGLPILVIDPGVDELLAFFERASLPKCNIEWT